MAKLFLGHPVLVKREILKNIDMKRHSGVEDGKSTFKDKFDEKIPNMWFAIKESLRRSSLGIFYVFALMFPYV